MYTQLCVCARLFICLAASILACVQAVSKLTTVISSLNYTDSILEIHI